MKTGYKLVIKTIKNKFITHT